MKKDLDMAEQQLLGWHSAVHGERLPSLIKGMGLKEYEWVKLKASGTVAYLTEGEVAEIDSVFAIRERADQVCSVCINDPKESCATCGYKEDTPSHA